ncbi:MAG: DUF3000 domain-containing protein, partial [Bifidobacteriaceae bacterium]|nr:DUF3000 domain-containing protein [Bifidobacteriaceae bacterium]
MSQNAQPTERFSRALASIRDWTYPPEVHLQEIPAPTRIAPLSVALEARVPASLRAPGPGAGTGGPAVPAGDSGDLAAGSFILLHDPNPPGVWGGDMRIVTVVKAQLEAELGSDPLLGEVAWTWLAEALDTEMPAPLHLAGTVTRTLSESFGDLRPRGSEVG